MKTSSLVGHELRFENNQTAALRGFPSLNFKQSFSLHFVGLAVASSPDRHCLAVLVEASAAPVDVGVGG